MPSRAYDAPTGGWNKRDSLDDMAENDAVVLDNFFPTTDGVESRRGFSSHVASLGSAGDYVETLIEYRSESTQKLIAASGSEIYDATTTNTDISLTTYSNARWQHAIQGANMVMVNGADTPQVYDASTPLANASFSGSGFTASGFIGVVKFSERLWYWEDNSQSLFYTAQKAHQGALTEFDLSGTTTLGGAIKACGVWTRDAGDGIDDILVIAFESGDVVLYSGDPGGTFTRQGKFKIGEPLSTRCMENYGSDLVIMTKDGYISLLAVLQLGEAAYNTPLSDKIRGAVTEKARSFGVRFGWQPIFYPRGAMFLFNVPTGANTYHQHVLNTVTGSWCRFTGQNAQCWAVYDGDLYFGGDAEIFKADDVYSDDSANIECDCITAFNYLGNRVNEKHLTMCEVVIDAAGYPEDGITTGADFELPPEPSSSTLLGTGGTPWGSAWGSPWSGGTEIQKQPQGVGELGECFAIRFKVDVKTKPVKWYSTRYIFKLGGYI